MMKKRRKICKTVGGAALKKKYWILLTLSIATILLSGCTEYREPISEDSEGFWNQFIVWPIVSIIKYFSDLLGSYGLGIIAVTIIIRLAILPLTIKQVQSSKKMQELQLKMQELQKKYSSKDAVTQQKYQQELMELMKTSGVNLGCLPALIQMPIIIGLYHAISRMNVTPEFELGTFLVFPLAEPSIVLAIAAGVIQYIVLMTGPAVDNPQMKMMLYIMPLMIIGFGMALPAALSLYWVVGNIISVVQNIFIYKKPWEKKESEKPATTGGAKK